MFDKKYLSLTLRQLLAILLTKELLLLNACEPWVSVLSTTTSPINTTSTTTTAVPSLLPMLSSSRQWPRNLGKEMNRKSKSKAFVSQALPLSHSLSLSVRSSSSHSPTELKAQSLAVNESNYD